MNIGVVVLSADKIVVQCSGAGASLLGVASHQALGQTIEQILRQRSVDCVLPADLHLLARKIADPDTEPQDFDVVFRRPTYRRLKVTVFPLGGKQEDDGVGLLIRDRSANPGNDDFLSNLSHELVNPITSVLGYSDLLGKAPLDEIQRGWLETIHANGQRLADLAEDLGEVTGLERGGRQGPEAILTLGDEIDEVLADTKLRTTFHQTEVRLNPGLPMVKTSRTSLGTILRCLLRNAFNYGPHGSTVTLSARHDKPSDRVVVSVKDQGQRIEETETGLVFAPFSQSRQLAGSSDSSTSLCLYIAKSLVENLGEEIWWESGLDDGATFHFSLAAAP